MKKQTDRMKRFIYVDARRIIKIFCIYFVRPIYRSIYRFSRLVRILHYFYHPLMELIVNYLGLRYSLPIYCDEPLDNSRLNHFFSFMPL